MSYLSYIVKFGGGGIYIGYSNKNFLYGIVVSRTNHILILKNDEEWIFPKGHVELDENLIDTACREVYEESGVNISSKDCKGMIDEFDYYFDGEEAISDFIIIAAL